MKTEQIMINKLIADDGKVLTDGETYGTIIFLGNGRTAEEFYEITNEEYETIIIEQEQRRDE